MSKAAKIVALLVVIAFLPSSVLNAAPVIWCVAGDDHAAIEISIAKRQHTVIERDSGARSAVAEADGLAPGDHAHPCFDYELMDPAMTSGVGGIDAPSLTAAISYGVPCKNDARYETPLAFTTIRSPPDDRAASAGLLKELRTTKLRL